MVPEHLNLESLNNLLTTQVIGKAPEWPNEVWETIDSTNNRALELAAQGAAEGLIVGAREQTAGRGRRGHSWVSAKDSGLYLSFIIRPHLAPSDLPMLSLVGGVAVAAAVENVSGVKPGLKWVNDIVYGGKKLGGILAEMAPRSSFVPKALVVGMGINVRFENELPPEIENSAVAIEQILGAPVDANQLAAEVAKQFERNYQILLAGRNSEIIDRWKQRTVTLGKQVKAISGQNTYEGVAKDITAGGALLLELPSGQTVMLHAGEVSIRNADGSYV